MTLAELNYNIYNKELLSTVTAFKKWKAILYSTIEPFKVITDYKNLTEFLTIKELNQRQVKQIEKLIKYYFKIKYTRETKNIKVNIFSKKIKL